MAISPHQDLAIGPKALQRLTAFGYGVHGDSYIFHPSNIDEFRELFLLAKNSSRKIVLRGSGRSYGDASIAPEQIAISLSNLNSILEFDETNGLITVEGGCRLIDICQYCLPMGFWMPVVSGTSLTTTAGAIAMDIHGKNNWQQGYFCDHVTRIGFLTTDGIYHNIVFSDPQFQAIRGSIGLYGIVVDATIQLISMPSPYINRIQNYCSNWSDLETKFDGRIEQANATVAWIDGFSNNRALFEEAVYPQRSSSSAKLSIADQDFETGKSGALIVKLMLNNPALFAAHQLRLLNAQLRNTRQQPIDLFSFNFQLDRFKDWDKAYLPGCLVQFQSTVPKEQAMKTFRDQVQVCKSYGTVPRLLVVKRHRTGSAILDYGKDGYSLAIDLHCPIGKRKEIETLYHELAKTTIAVNGCVYLAKDFLLTRDEFAEMHSDKKIHEFISWKKKLDPAGLLYSSMGERLGLIER